ACGPDGCGTTCGTCGTGTQCSADAHCVCAPNCGGRQCGDDGCGGSCGGCGTGSACDQSGQCACSPSCGGKQCGDDGCGGACGSCQGGQTCNASDQCTYPTKSFATDVYPIFQLSAVGCPGCHRGAAPPQGLNLSSVATAYANLVSVAATECAPSRLRVEPGSPTTSYLINKLTGSGMCSGVRMPKGRTPLSSTQIDVIRAWIGSGAAQ
ncbi:MAG: hypothetical protein ACHQ53_17870, partial [Polyangiales bacterium]